MKILTPENIDFNSLSTLIFDWGGVITNIDPKATIQSFMQIGHKTFDKYFHNQDDDLFYRFEKGQAEPTKIYHRLLKEIGEEVSEHQMERAFCAMLADTPDIRIKIIQRLRRSFQLILLSNTNIIHTTFYNRFLLEKKSIDFPALFHKVYYSYQLGMRKPDSNIFEYVISENTLNPSTTLFIDDTEQNTDAASSLGINTFHLAHGITLEKVFSKWRN
jgi:glucose-1-phosphatase